MKNYLVIPAYYQGTSFEDIVTEMLEIIKSLKISVEIIGQTFPLPNNLDYDELEDDTFFRVQQKIIDEIFSKVTCPSNLLFVDFFFPSLDLLKFYFIKKKIKVKLGGLLHGGFFLEGDIFKNENWLKYFEMGYFQTYDVVYSPSFYLKSRVLNKNFQDKVFVSSWGLEHIKKQVNTEQIEKKYDVIFPHRITFDKGVEELIYIIEKLHNVSFCITLPQSLPNEQDNEYLKILRTFKNIELVIGENKNEHIKTLKSAKIILSCAKQENFGYSVHKAVLCGCIPLLPNDLCYPEFFNNEFLYNDLEEAISKITQTLKTYDKNSSILIEKLSNQIPSFENILKHFFYG